MGFLDAKCCMGEYQLQFLFTVDSHYNKLLGTREIACYNKTLLHQGYKNNTIKSKSDIRDH